jgi:hypothetical protein
MGFGFEGFSSFRFVGLGLEGLGFACFGASCVYACVFRGDFRF